MHSSLQVRSARRGLLAYLLVVAALSAVMHTVVITNGGNFLLIEVLMFMPALASVIVRLVRHEGFGDVSFRWGGRRTWLAIAAGFGLPLIVGAVAYGTAWTLGLAELNIPDTLAGGSPLGRFARLLLVSGGLTTVVGLVGTTGEEVGWRGYMLLRLIEGRVPYPILVSGVIWGLWHMPLILSGLYAAGPNPLESAMVFMISVAAMSFLFAWARLSTGSIWPAVIMHAAWNALIQSVFDRVTVGPDAQLWVGESGLLVAATLIVLAVVVARGRLSLTTAKLAGSPLPPPTFAEGIHS